MEPSSKPQHARPGDQAQTELVFRSVPVLLLLALAALFLGPWGLVMLLRNVDRYGGLFSPTVLFALALIVTYCIFAVGAVGRLWRTQVTFVLTQAQLTAMSPLTGQRVNVPWSSIRRVTKLQRGTPWQPRWGPEIKRGNIAFSVIETADGARIIFGNHVSRYGEFLAEVRARAIGCREFDPFLQ